MTNVISIDDHRPAGFAGPAEVTFFGFRFEGDDGETRQLNMIVNVENGDFEGIISAVRENGGWYVENEDEGTAWFLPWPPAAVRVRPKA